MRILVAEDDLLSQEVIVRLLRHFGHRADVVADGQAAVEATTRREYDLVLLDINMSPMDGPTACLEISKHMAAERRPPIYFLSASGMPRGCGGLLETIVSGCLSKPVTLNQLRETLDRVGEGAAHGDATGPERTGECWALPRFFADTGCEAESIQGMLAEFLRGARQLSEELRMNANAENYPLAVRAAHSLKGMSRQMGAERLGSMAEHMESAGQQQFIDSASIEAAAQELRFVERAIAAYLCRKT